MFIYEILRLIIIAVLLVYFIGSVCYLLSDKLNDAHIHDNQTFIKTFQLDIHNLWEKLIICCYFSLTMLSTVGYGDFYPVS